MANGPALSTAKRGEIYIGSKITDRISLLDVVYANQFEGEIIDPTVVDQTEKNFYRGAPPEWLNFHISEQAASDGKGTPFIRRDGYGTLVEQIQKQRKFPGISVVNLFHQPGCGGTTLAMNVLWDLRKTFRSAVLTGSTSDITEVAEEVVHLFTAGSRGHQNTVLLLVNDEKILENLQDSIMMKIAEQKIVIHMPVVILLNCVRKDEFRHGDQVFLQDVLSETEEKKFNEKKEELCRRFGDKCKQFHGFNIMQTNFSQAYIDDACSVFNTIKKANRPKKTQLAAFLSLLNAYVPGSYLLESQCLDFFNHDDYIHGDFSLEDRMKPFSHLIITFQPDGSEKRVCMAHPMIAQCCTELMAEAGVTRSDTAKNLLTCLCRDDIPPFLVGFVKDMLTKRRPKPKEMITEENPISSEEEQERFSRLILDIQSMEDEKQCVSVLKLATTKFDRNPFFPQALARFYYIELKDYNLAEMWAERAKQRDPLNSFIADTLGQVHKNHLKNIECDATPREILQLATKAIEAFKDEERLAENEHGTDMKGDGMTKVSHVFNTRGQFGYLQVCNLVYDKPFSHNETWRDEVVKKCAFFDKYLTYSKPSTKKDDPSYISEDTSECYRNYVGDFPPKHFKQKGADLIQKLKQNQVDTSAGVLSCLDRECTRSDLKEITTWWEGLFLHKDSGTALANYILAILPSKCREREFKLPLIPNDSPELHMLALLLCWPTDSEDKCVTDLSELILGMQRAYKHAYTMHFRSRYLRPLFFIGKGHGLDRIVHRKVLEKIFLDSNQETIQDWSNWSNEKIFQEPKVQEHLLSVTGEVRNCRVYATVGGTLIKLDANLRNSLWKHRQVFFYLGFTIRGPVAFAIQTRPAEKAQVSVVSSSEPEQIQPDPSASADTTGGQHFVDRHQTALIKRVTDTEKKEKENWSDFVYSPRVDHGGEKRLRFGRRKWPSGKVKLGTLASAMDSSDWTELEPVVNTTDEDQTYSLQSDAGRFECSVSALRWVCKEKVSFKYQFCSWEELGERPSCMDYMPAGPLLDITVTAGKLEEVHLPHWVCVDQNSKMSNMFVVLHVDTCGDVLEQVSEVTSSHVKLLQPIFSPRMVMIRKILRLPVRLFYDALIFMKIQDALTLHVYLVPPDPALQKEVEKQQNSRGSTKILKPGPDKSMQLGSNFSLTTDKADAKIQPSTRELRNDGRNLFEVFIRNADSDFTLKLESEQNTVWTCPIYKEDYQNQSTDHKQAASGQHFVDCHRTALINRVYETVAVLDELLDRELISKASYDAVTALKTTRDQMRDIHRFVTAAGNKGKDALYEILKGMNSMRPLLSELEGSQ